MPTSTRKRFLLIHNAIAGLKGRSLVEDVVANLERRGASVTRCAPGEQAMRDAVADASQHFDVLIAAGGDGTVRALAAALNGAAAPIALIPMGTGNVLASETAMPRRAAALSDVITNGPVQHIEGARANGQPFYLMAGAGFDGAAVSGLKTPLKRRLGKLAYAGPGFAALASKPPLLDITIDGKAYAANWVVFANGQRYGGPFTITRRSDLRTPGLHAVLITAPTRRSLAGMVARLAAGALDRTAGVAVVPCKKATVRSAQKVLVQVDGDLFGETPLEIEAGGCGFGLIVPDAYAQADRGIAQRV
jgi:diacylglycerol kinase (ATP)